METKTPQIPDCTYQSICGRDTCWRVIFNGRVCKGSHSTEAVAEAKLTAYQNGETPEYVI